MGIKNFTFIGNLTRDAEVSQNEGKSFATLRIAVNDVWKDANNVKQERVNFFRVKAFDDLAHYAGKYLGKGSKVYIEGRIQNFEYGEEGDKTYGNDFVANKIEYLNTNPPGEESNK